LAGPDRPATTLLSAYTGYTGSISATVLSRANSSCKLALSLLPPSLMKTSSTPIFTPRAPKSCSAMAPRRNS
jgi:hypothetical protein